MSNDRQPATAEAVQDGESRLTIGRNAMFLVAGQAITTALAIVFSAALGRSLGVNDFGIYYLITTTSAFAYVLAEWGQPLLVIRQAAREPLRAGELLGTALAIRLALGLAVTVPAALVTWGLGYGPRTTSLSVFLILANLPLFLAQGYAMVFRARDRMGRDAAVSVANKAIVVCLALPALALGAGIPGVIVAQAVAGGAALWVAVRFHAQLSTPSLRLTSAAAHELLARGAPILAMTAATSVQPYLDAIILTKLAPPATVGWFGAARTVLGTLIAPAAILGAAVYPRVARASAETAALGQTMRSVLRPMLWLGALAGTGTYLFASTAIGLIYGRNDFGPAATILEVFAPGFFLLFIDILLGNVIYASGGGTGFAIAKIFSVVVATVLNFLLIPWFQQRFGNGGIGVVVAFALSELVVFAGALATLRRGTLQPVMALDLARAVMAAAATIALFRLLPPIPAWAGMPLCVGTFAGASLAFGLLDVRDLTVLLTLVRRPAVNTPAAGEPGV